MPNHLAGSTGSWYREEFIISSGSRLVSFVKGCEKKKKEEKKEKNKFNVGLRKDNPILKNLT